MRIFVGFFLFVGFFGFSFGECIYNSLGFWECSKTKNVFLEQNLWNFGDKIDNNSINISDMNFDEPKECENEFCFKETYVTITVKKTRKPISIVINNENLKPRDFAKNFPNISEKKLLNNNSPIYDRYILQKVLYERGLLSVKPTGKIGYLTEQAIMKLQCIKDIKEFNRFSGIFVIGPKTITEVNKIKDNMKDPKYLKNTRVPFIDFAICGNEFLQRNKKIESLLGNPPSRANNNYTNSINPNYQFKVEGEIKIRQTE